jgi:arylsulfatase A-like enzyme
MSKFLSLVLFRLLCSGLLLHRLTMPTFAIASVFASLMLCSPADAENSSPRSPNVVLIVTDDQGYGDLGCMGNPVLETPQLDKLYRESVRLTDFHVDPTCSPTRAALMTGRYSTRTGVWHTVMGRHMPRAGERMMPQVFADNGYATAMFGKWHLGDNCPFRPQDRGFQEVLMHGGGGVGQIPDYWGNDYFDDTYFHNGRPEKFTGYCTRPFAAAAR